MEEEKRSVLKNPVFWIVIVLITIGVYAAPILVMYIHRTGKGFNYGEVGTMGDSYGMVAPFINLGAAVFVYLAFQQQLEANRLLKKQIDEDKADEIFRKHFEQIDNMIYKLSVKYNKKDYFGYDAIYPMLRRIADSTCQEFDGEPDAVEEKFKDIILFYDAIHEFDKRENVSIQEQRFTGLLLSRSIQRFTNDFAEFYYAIPNHTCHFCQSQHYLPSHIMESLYRLSQKYLGDFQYAGDILSEWKKEQGN